MNLATAEAIGFHHWPGRASPQGFSILLAVHVANGMEHDLGLTEELRTWSLIDRGFLEANNQGDALDRWVGLFAEQA